MKRPTRERFNDSCPTIDPGCKIPIESFLRECTHLIFATVDLYHDEFCSSDFWIMNCVGRTMLLGRLRCKKYHFGRTVSVGQ